MRMRLALPLCALSATLAAQEATEKELLDLLNTPLTVASAKAATLRESPGVITVLTREEIQATGARDLIDVLRQVPGFDFGYDVEGATGLFARGLWAYEGKALVVWDGIEVPELLYGNTLFGHRFPVDQIKRIEIIRGPGSAIYGGLAELAVIKVTTLDSDDLKTDAKAGLGAMYGGNSGGALRQAWHALAAPDLGGKTKLSIGAFMDQGRRSTATYTDADGLPHDTSQNTDLRSRMLNVGFATGAFSARGLLEEYRVEDPATLPPASSFRTFGSQNADLRYAWQLGKDLTLTPAYTYRRVESWYKPGRERTVQRDKGAVTLGWDISTSSNLTAGLERYTDSASVAGSSAGLTGVTFDGDQRVTYGVMGAFGEFSWRGPLNLTVGGRYEKHDVAGSAFVPRFALTWVGGAFHAKLLYAGAFRTPNVQVFALRAAADTKIESEKTQDIELEGGWQMGSSITTLTLFRTKLDKPLVYGTLGYSNGPQAITKGAEVEWKWRQSWGFLNASFSMNKADSQVADWSVPGHDDRFLGAASQKIAAMASIKLGWGWRVEPSLVRYGDRYGYAWDASVSDVTLQKIDAALVTNLQLAWTEGPWTFSVAGMDLGRKGQPFVEAYPGYSSGSPGGMPLPDSGRELVMKLRWGF